MPQINNKNYGAKRIVVGAHYGLADWLAQRISAALMALLTLAVIVQVLLPGEMGYDKLGRHLLRAMDEGADLRRHPRLAYHAWVGMRDIWMDYVKHVGVRLLVMVFTMVWLIGCAGWAVQVLWRL